jgi:tRNA threonylcarbamoyladenosine biosynthesis protein TsaE
MIQNVTLEIELPELAKKILLAYPHKRIFGFYGEMGAGKTTLIKEICKVLGVKNITSSPSFAIVNEYTSADDEPVYHFDFYRIEKLEDAYQIGFEEYLNSNYYCFIEWTDKVEPILKDDFVKIEIKMFDDGHRMVYY